MDLKNTLLDDICADIGYTATSVLCAWYGGRPLHVPKFANPEHPIARLIGQSAFAKLTKSFGDTDIFIPKNTTFDRFSRWRTVRDLLRSGMRVDKVGLATGLTPRRVMGIRRTLEQYGYLNVVLKEPAEQTDVD